MSVIARATAPGAPIAPAVRPHAAAAAVATPVNVRCQMKSRSPTHVGGFYRHELAISLVPITAEEAVAAGGLAFGRSLALEVGCTSVGARVVSGRRHSIDSTSAATTQHVFDAVLDTPSPSVAWGTEVTIVASIDGAPAASVVFEHWIDGSDEAEAESTWGVPLTATHADNQALVRVFSTDEGITFELKHRASERKTHAYCVSPPSCDGEDFAATLDAFVEFAGQVTQVIHWLNGVVATQASGLVVVIEDHTDFGLPWEMLPLHSDKPLGAIVDVVRWHLIPLRAGRVDLPKDHFERRGSVVAYLDGKLSSVQRERAALALCDAETVDFAVLVQRLRQLPPGCALVLLGCHATFKRNGAGTEIAHPAHGQALTPTSIVRMTPPPVGQRPAVLINGCFSARFSLRARGFPQLFLEKLETEYIGTLGFVKDRDAAEIGARIIEEARKAGGVVLASVLRAIRAEAAVALEQDKFDADVIARYVSAFSYVLYGSHRTALVLDPPKNGVGGV